MADRKASVALELNAGQFKAEVLTVGRAIDNLDDKVEDLDKDITKIPPDAARAAAAMKLLGGDVGLVGDRVKTLGDKSVGLSVLDARIRTSRVEVRKLADEFVRTGDIDVFKKLGEAEGRLRGLQDVRKKLSSALVDGASDAGKGIFKRLTDIADEAGRSAGKLFTGGLTGVLSSPGFGPILAGSLIAAVVAAAPLVMSAAAGALLGGAALGGVGLGIMGAVMGNPEVIGKAWQDQIQKITTKWIGASNVFRGPVLEAIAKIGDVINDLPLDRIFAKAASYMPALVSGAAGLARYLGQAFAGLVDDAGPVMKALSAELPKLGYAVKQAFAAIGGGSEGGAQALKDILQITEKIIIGLGRMIGKAAEIYGAFAKVRDAIIPRDWFFTPDAEENLITAARALDDLGSSALMSADDLLQLSTTLNSVAITADSLAGQMVGKIFDATMGLDQATLQWHQSLLAVRESLKENGRNLDINTEKGQANRDAILGAVTANMQIYQAQLKAGMTAADAAAHYDVNTAALERQLRKAGLTAKEIDGLIGKYRGVPTQVDTNIAMHGLESAIRQLNETIRLINGIRDKTVTITVKQVGDLPMGQSRGGGWAKGGIRRKAATGMIMAPSDPGVTLAAEPETGGEALIPLRGISRPRAMQLAQVVGNAHGFDVVSRGSGSAAVVAEQRRTNELLVGLAGQLAKQRMGHPMYVTASQGQSTVEIAQAVIRELNWGSGL